jgi:hypothetical protein
MFQHTVNGKTYYSNDMAPELVSKCHTLDQYRYILRQKYGNLRGIKVSRIHPYFPNRARPHWLEGAPEYVLDVFDNKGKTCDRYTILLGGSQFDADLLKDRKVFYLALSENPWHPQGFSQWGEIAATFRPAHQRIRWLDLPERTRNHIAARVAQG